MSSLSHRSYDGWASQVAVVVKNPPANAGDIRDTGSIPWLGRSLRRGQSNPLQCSCLENPIDREDWRVTIQRIAKSQTQLKRYGMHIWWLWLLSTFITLGETGGKRLAFSLSQKKNKTKQNRIESYWLLLARLFYVPVPKPIADSCSQSEVFHSRSSDAGISATWVNSGTGSLPKLLPDQD